MMKAALFVALVMMGYCGGAALDGMQMQPPMMKLKMLQKKMPGRSDRYPAVLSGVPLEESVFRFSSMGRAVWDIGAGTVPAQPDYTLSPLEVDPGAISLTTNQPFVMDLNGLVPASFTFGVKSCWIDDDKCSNTSVVFWPPPGYDTEVMPVVDPAPSLEVDNCDGAQLTTLLWTATTSQYSTIQLCPDAFLYVSIYPDTRTQPSKPISTKRIANLPPPSQGYWRNWVHDWTGIYVQDVTTEVFFIDPKNEPLQARTLTLQLATIAPYNVRWSSPRGGLFVIAGTASQPSQAPLMRLVHALRYTSALEEATAMGSVALPFVEVTSLTTVMSGDDGVSGQPVVYGFTYNATLQTGQPRRFIFTVDFSAASPQVKWLEQDTTTSTYLWHGITRTTY